MRPQPSAVVKVGDRIRLTAGLSKAIIGAIGSNSDHLVVTRLAVERKAQDEPADITIELGPGGVLDGAGDG